MPRPLPCLLPLLLAAGCSPLPAPVCAQPEVLQLLSERLARAGTAQTFDVGSLNQRPGPTPRTTQCAIRLNSVLYDTNRFGPAPVAAQAVVQYAVEQRTNGIFLLPEPR